MQILIIMALLLPLSSIADATISKSYQHYIDQEWPSPFNQTDKALEGLRTDIGPGLASSLVNHIAREKQLISFREDLEGKAVDAGLDPKNIAISLLSQIHGNMNGQNSADLANFVIPAAEHASTFFAQLDSHIQDSMDLTLAISFHSLRLWISENLTTLNEAEVREFKTLYSHLQSSLKKYIENKDQYGQNKDTLRVSPYKRYFNTLAAFAQKRARQSNPTVNKNNSFFNRIQNFCATIQKFAAATPDGYNVLKEVLFPDMTVGTTRRLGRSVHRTVRALNPTVELRVSGVENLPIVDPASNKVYIFAASHKDGLGDQLGLSELKRDDLVIFGAPNNFIKAPKLIKDFFIRRLNKNIGFIVVGAGATEKPIAKSVRLALQTGARVFLIFPEGRLPEGLGGSMGIREGFNAPEGLIAQLNAAGFEPVIIPISMRNNARLFNGKALTELSSEDPGIYSSGLDIKVAPQISAELRHALDKLAGPQALGFVLRYGLLEDMVTDENLLWGQLRADRLVSQLAKHIGPPAAECAELLLRQ